MRILIASILLAAACGGGDEPAKKPAPAPANVSPVRAPDAEPAPSGAAFSARIPDGVVRECREYVAAAEAYIACPSMPQDVREGLALGLEEALRVWADFASMSTEVKQAYADSCKRGFDAVEQAAASLGCPL